MSVRAFEQLSALPPQRLPSVAANASAIGIHRLLCICFVFPFPTTPIRFGDATANTTDSQIYQHVVAMISLVGHHFRQRFGMQMFPGLKILRHSVQIQLGLQQRPRQRFGVAFIGTRQGHGNDRLRVHVHRVLHLVRQMSATILHLGNAGIRIVRMFPVLIGAFLWALLVDPGQILSRRRSDARGFGQLREKLVVTLARVPAHDAAHGGIGIQHRGVDAQRLPLQQFRFGQHLQHPVEDLLMRLVIHQPARARHTRMIGRALVQLVAEEVPQRQRIGHPPGDLAFWWESHEQWELLWKPLDRHSREGLFLRGLIQASATLLKVHAGNERGVSQLFRRSRSNLMAAAGDGHHPYMGLEVQPFVANLQRFIETTAAGGAHDNSVIADPPVIKLSRPDGGTS